MNNPREFVKWKIRAASGVDQADARIRELLDTVEKQRVRIGDLERELARVSPQVAALEARLESLRELVEDGLNGHRANGSSESVDQASLLAEFRRQQEQVRARLSAATRFEERLRKLEQGRVM